MRLLPRISFCYVLVRIFYNLTSSCSFSLSFASLLEVPWSTFSFLPKLLHSSLAHLKNRIHSKAQFQSQKALHMVGIVTLNISVILIFFFQLQRNWTQWAFFSCLTFLLVPRVLFVFHIAESWLRQNHEVLVVTSRHFKIY